MASTNFSSGTVVTSTWLNEVDSDVFDAKINIKLAGAVGDGVTDDTTAIQTALNGLINFTGSGLVYFPRGTYRITSSLTLPAGWAFNTIDFQGSTILYDGPTSSTAAVFKMTKNQCYFNTFKNGYLNANNKAGYCIYAVGEGWQFAIKANKIENMELRYPTVSCVQIGDQTGTGNDQDGADWLFHKVYFRALTPAISGAILDGDNVFNTNFTHCFHNTDSGNTSAGHIRVIRAGSTFIYDAFFGNIDSSAYCIDHRSGILGVYGANSEEGSILKTQDMVEERKSIVLSGIMVNESTASSTPEYAVYAPVGQLEIRGCTFGKSNIFPRKIYVGDSLHASNVYLGSNSTGTVWGTYELDFPDRCSVEGQYLNNVKILNANPTLNLWKGTGVGAYPFGYDSSGFGSFTVEQSTNNNTQGPYTALITVTTGYGTGNDIDGLQCQIPIATTTKTGARSYLAILRGAVAASSTGTIKARMNVYNNSGTFLNGNNITITPDGGGFFNEMFFVTADNETASYITVTVGSGTASATASIYIDNIYILQIEPFTVNAGAHYKSYVDIWTKHVNGLEGMLEYVKSGTLVAGTPGSFNQMYWAAAAPTVGTFRRGDVVWNTGVSAGGSPGWVCTTAGSPGTWKTMANVAA